MSHNGTDRQEVKPPAEQKGGRTLIYHINTGSA